MTEPATTPAPAPPSAEPPDPAGRRATTSLDRVLVVVSFAVVAGLGLYMAFAFPVWSKVDEGVHFDYVRYVREQHQLPTLAEPMSPLVTAIDDGTFPEPSPNDPGGQLYEAFQPPLYYLTAAPLYAAAPDAEAAVPVLRLYSLALTLGAFGVFALLARDVVGEGRWGLAVAFGGLFLCLPGTMARSISITNEPMVMLATMLVVWGLWRLLERDRWQWGLLACGATGAALLTKTSAVVLVPVVAVGLALWAWRARDWRRAGAGVAGLALAGGLLVPWLVWNHSEYGTWTSTSQAQAMQIGVVNPTGQDLGLGDVGEQLAGALDASVPQEWGPWKGEPLPTAVAWFFVVAFFALPALLFPFRAADRVPLLLVLAAPLLLSIGFIGWLTAVQDWPSMLARYLREGSLPWFLLAFVVWERAARSTWVATRLLGAAVVAQVALWTVDVRRHLL